MGFTGEPVPPGIRNGAHTSKNSKRSACLRAVVSSSSGVLSRSTSPIAAEPIWSER